MGTEIADFIGISSKSKKIFYIHCKHNESDLSASSFQEVCGQANKNMRYISNTTQEDNKYFEDRKRKWKVKWPYHGRNAKDGYINRCILGGNAEDIHKKLKRMMLDPDTKYEIWLVNSGLSYESFKNQIIREEEKQSEEVPQIIWLLQSIQDYFSQVNTTVKILCKP